MQIEEYIYILESELKVLAGNNYITWKSFLLPKNSDTYLTVDLSEWNNEEREIILKDVLKGIHYYYFEYTNKRSFALGAYNEVINSFDGKNEIQIYKKAFKRFKSETLELLSNSQQRY